MAILQPDLIKVEGVDERIPLFEFRGGELKPSVFVVAGQHGGEISGIGVAYRLIEYLKGIDIQGRVSIIPILNVWGVRAGTRENPLDGITINSCYEGGAESLSYRLADLVKELAAGYDYVLDLHSAGYVRYERHTFHDTRYPYAQNECRKRESELKLVVASQRVACHLVDGPEGVSNTQKYHTPQ